jgi:hypothetical protein
MDNCPQDIEKLTWQYFLNNIYLQEYVALIATSKIVYQFLLNSKLEISTLIAINKETLIINLSNATPHIMICRRYFVEYGKSFSMNEVI